MDVQAWINLTGVTVAILALIISTVVSGYNLRTAQQEVAAAREQTELQRRIAAEAAQPVIWADVRPREDTYSVMHFFVGNSGHTIATNVRVTIEPPLPTRIPSEAERPDKPELRSFQEDLQKGLSSLPPGRQIKWFMFSITPNTDDWWDLMPDGGGLHHVTIRACDVHGNDLPIVEYDIDMRLLIREQHIGTGTLFNVAQEIKAIKNQLANRR